MRSKNISHSKHKNTGILFELLVRQIAVDTMEGKKNPPAIDLMRKYFHPNTEMGKELQLYRSFFEINKLTENKSIQFIDLLTSQRKKLSEKLLAKEKYEFIRELRENYDLEKFLKVKVPSYKVYASIYKTFLAESSTSVYTNIQDVVKSRFVLVEHLCHADAVPSKAKRSDVIFESLKAETEDLRILTLKLMIEQYNQKYQYMNNKQKSLLKEYINSKSDGSNFEIYFKKECKSLAESFNKITTKVDKVTAIKLKEVANTLTNFTAKKKITDSDMTCAMIAYQILDELK